MRSTLIIAPACHNRNPTKIFPDLPRYIYHTAPLRRHYSPRFSSRVSKGESTSSSSSPTTWCGSSSVSSNSLFSASPPSSRYSSSRSDSSSLPAADALYNSPAAPLLPSPAARHAALPVQALGLLILDQVELPLVARVVTQPLAARHVEIDT